MHTEVIITPQKNTFIEDLKMSSATKEENFKITVCMFTHCAIAGLHNITECMLTMIRVQWFFPNLKNVEPKEVFTSKFHV